MDKCIAIINVLVSFNIDFCLDRIMLESTERGAVHKDPTARLYMYMVPVLGPFYRYGGYIELRVL